MIDVQDITQRVVDEVISTLAPAHNGEMEAQIVRTSADVAARILEEYQRQNRMGWPVH